MREKRGSGTFARRMEEALAPLLFFLFVFLPLSLYYKSFTLCLSHAWLLHFSQKSVSVSLDFIPPYPCICSLPVSPCTLVNVSEFFPLALKNPKCFTPCQVGISQPSFLPPILIWVPPSVQFMHYTAALAITCV